MVAAARYHAMIQWWHGRSMPMAGVASVMVAPEDRGQGTGTALVTAVLGAIAGRGYPVSVLYPATMSVYRALGWEIAGIQDAVQIPARSLRTLVPPDRWLGDHEPGSAGPGLRRCGPQDASEVLAVTGGVHEAMRDCGPNTRDEPAIRGWLGDEDRYAYLAHDGFLAYRWRGGDSEILVERAIAGSAATARALWAVVASHSSMAGQVRAYLGPADPLCWLIREPDLSVARRHAWMLRVVDAAAAVAARGFPPAATLTARLRLADAACPGNDGLWTLEVDGGRGTLSPVSPGTVSPSTVSPSTVSPGTGGDGDPLVLGARGFAALYAGTPVATLRRAGLAAGGSAAGDAGLDTAFAASPFMLDYF
jgi:hypothetical protein